MTPVRMRDLGLRSSPLVTSSSAQAILEHLEKSNLFLIPLDNRRQWYRYHHLFADLLNSRLQSVSPDLMARLHCRASQWYEQAGMTADAVDHALLAEDFDRALGLIEHAARTSIWSSGDLPVLLNWSNRLPEKMVRTRPRLCLYYARALFFAGQVEPAEGYLQAAAQALELRPQHDPATIELHGLLATNQATFAAMRCEPQAALDLAEHARSHLPADDLSSRARVAHAEGMAHYVAGRMRPAEQAYAQGIQLARAVGNRNLGLDLSACLGLTLLMSGRARQALQVCDEALAADPTFRTAPAACAIYITQAEVLYNLNQLPLALERMQTGLKYARQMGWAHVQWRGYVMLSAIQLGLGDVPAARSALQRFEQATQNYHIPALQRLIDAWEARVRLSLGEREPAARWAEAYSDQLGEGTYCEFEDLSLVRVWLAHGRSTEALTLLDARLVSARAEGREQSVIEILVLRALACLNQNNACQALETICQALELAEPECYVRLFLDRGEVLGGPAPPGSPLETQPCGLGVRHQIAGRR